MTDWFHHDDDGYLAWLVAHPEGFVLNTWAHMRPGYLVLHRATCRTISPRNGDDRRWTDQYGKACDVTRAVLVDWCRERTGAEPTDCGTCDPRGGGRAPLVGPRAPRVVPAAPVIDATRFSGAPVRVVIDRVDGGPRVVIDGAQWLAETFFRHDASAVGPDSYDAATRTTAPDRFEDQDITALNRTMAARTGHIWWADLLAPDPSPILRALGHGWDLALASDEEWTSIRSAAVHAIESMRAPHRELAVITKMLHLKRPALVPVLDSLVVELLGGRGRTTADLLGHLRLVARRNLDALSEVQAHLAGLLGDDGLPIERSIVRILDALLWTSHPGSILHPRLDGWQSTVAIRSDASASFRLPTDPDDVGMSTRLLLALPMLAVLVQCVAEADDGPAELALSSPTGGRVRVRHEGGAEDLVVETDHRDATPPYQGALHEALVDHGFLGSASGYALRVAFPDDTAFLETARLIVGTFQHVWGADLRDAVKIELRLGT